MRKEVNFNHRIVLLCLLGIAVTVLSLSIGSSWTTSANNDGKVRRHTLKNNAALASPVSEISSSANEWLFPGEYESHQAMWMLWPVFENKAGFPSTEAVSEVGVSGSAHGQPVVSPCDPNAPETCRYRSDLQYEVGVVDGIELVDSSRNNYRIPLRIQYPIGLAGPRPVVIWNHGGNPSANGNTRSENWGRVLAAAGYIVIHPSRVPVENPEDSQCECTENGFNSPDECAQWLANLRFGPQNTHFIIDNLTRIVSMAPRFAGLFDISRIVVAGHSAGTTTVFANAGASQQWLEGGQTYNERDDRPIAFLATGPMGPLYAGFRAGFGSTSFLGMERPLMFITGVGDETGEPPESRTTGWLRSPAGNKVLSWDTDRRAVHETMNIDKCDTPTRRDHCRWIASAGLAFLDAVVRERVEARNWIGSDSLKLLSGGAIEIHRR